MRRRGYFKRPKLDKALPNLAFSKATIWLRYPKLTLIYIIKLNLCQVKMVKCHFGFKSEQFWAIFGFKSEQNILAVFK